MSSYVPYTMGNKVKVMEIATISWATSQLSSSMIDAFRIYMFIRDSICVVGTLCIVSIKLINLSNTVRNLKLVISDSYEESYIPSIYNQHKRNRKSRYQYIGDDNAAADEIMVSESKIYLSTKINVPKKRKGVSKPVDHVDNNLVTSSDNDCLFDMWPTNIVGNGRTTYKCDRGLLIIDTTLLFGEVKGQHCVHVEVRIIPVREGTLE